MNYRFSMLMSITLLMTATAAQAAQASKALVEIPKFKTVADIPQAKHALAGFFAGSTQQVALFGLIGQHTKTPSQCAFGLLGQWGLSAIGSLCLQINSAENVRHLAAHDTECAHMIFNTVAPLNINSSSEDARDREQRSRNFAQRYKAGGAYTADVYNAYNKLLTENVQWQSFCRGYLIASVLGPLPSFAVLAALIRLGIIQC